MRASMFVTLFSAFGLDDKPTKWNTEGQHSIEPGYTTTTQLLETLRHMPKLNIKLRLLTQEQSITILTPILPTTLTPTDIGITQPPKAPNPPFFTRIYSAFGTKFTENIKQQLLHQVLTLKKEESNNDAERRINSNPYSALNETKKEREAR